MAARLDYTTIVQNHSLGSSQESTEGIRKSPIAGKTDVRKQLKGQTS